MASKYDYKYYIRVMTLLMFLFRIKTVALRTLLAINMELAQQQ